MVDRKENKLRELHGMEDTPIPYADYVQLTTSPQVGTVLTFSQMRFPTEKNFIVGQVFLPHEVAARMALLVLQQLHKVEQDTGKKIIPDNVHLEVKSKSPN